MAIGLIVSLPNRTHAVDPLPAEGMSAAALNTMWSEYGNAGGHWTGGDRTFSVLLPDGRLAWLFSDTFLGTVNADGSRPTNSPMVHNTLVLQDGTRLTTTLHSGTATSPQSLMCDDSVGLGCWVAGAIVDGPNLRVLVNRYEATGPGSLDVVATGNALVTLSLPALTVTEVRELPLSPKITWGQALINDDGYTYIYGSEHTPDFKFAHVARVPVGELTGSWQFWTGSDWSQSQTSSARLVSGVGTAFAVTKVDGHYLLVTMEGHLTFNNAIVAYTADAPTGPFSSAVELGRAPVSSSSSSTFIYDTSLHPDLARDGKLLISYNVNTLNPEESIADVTIYRPRFIEVDWPRPVPDPAQLPAAPTGLAATADTVGGVHLSWQPVAEPGVKYWTYQRDVTAGQIQWVRLPASTTATSMDLSFLKDGHTYEYRVVAENTVGEGQPSNVVSATVDVEPPPAPGNLNAVAQASGEVVLSWQAAERSWHYSVERRDLTAGETEWKPLTHPDATATTLTVGMLEHQHEYEFRVRGVGGGGAGAWSVPARATARYAVPQAPTGLTATATSNGDIALAWTAPPGEVWHRVYQRDITAGESQFTAWPLPVVSGTTVTATYLLHSHEYEFQVAATNRGGDSAPSNTARAIASFTLPGAPTALTATAGDGQATLSWQAPGPNVWHRVHQRDVTAGETTFAVWELPITDGTTVTGQYLINGHEYEFKVTATNAGGEGPASNLVRVTPAPALPAAPTSLTANAKPDGNIELTWQAPSANVWYAVYQRDITAGATAFSKWPLPIPGDTSAVAQYLTHGHEYEFRVAATNAAGEGPGSNLVRATAIYTPPNAPSNLRGAAIGEGKIELNWDAPAPGVYSVIYGRDVTAGQTDFTRIEYLSAATSITMEYLTHAHTYEYKVAATNAGGEGPASASIQVTAYYSLPAPPSGLTASAGDGVVALHWTASPTPGVEYFVYSRDTTAGQSWQRTALPLTNTWVTMEYLHNGHWYEFRVTASNAAGQSAPSNTVSARPLPPLPEPPSNLTAAPGDGKATLSWTASPTPNVYYWVESRDITAGQDWRRAQYPVPGGTSITMGLLHNGHTYEFRVRATNVAGDGAPSNVARVRPMPPLPQPPSNLTVTSISCAVVALSWTASPTPYVYYWVESRDVSTGQGWTRTKYPVTGTSITMQWLTNTHLYEFRVRATNISGDSSSSNVVSARPMAPAPAPTQYLNASEGPGKVGLIWSKSATTGCGEPYYEVEVRNRYERSSWFTLGWTLGTSWEFFSGNSHDVFEFRAVAVNATARAYSYTESETTLWVGRSWPKIRPMNVTNGSNGTAAAWALAHGSSCHFDTQQIICFGSSPGGNQPMTVGDYLHYPHSLNAFRVYLRRQAFTRICLLDRYDRSIAADRGPDLMRHEAIHSEQWSRYLDAKVFTLEYGAATAFSRLRYGNNWEGNWFEIEANLYHGSYKTYDSSC